MDILNIQTLSRSICNLYINQNHIRYWLESYFSNTTWKVSVFFVFLVRIFPHSDWIWEILSISMDSVRMREITVQKKLQIRTPFTQWFLMLKIHCQNNQEPKCWKIENLFNFLLLKFCGNTKTRKVGEITVLYALQNIEKSCLLFFFKGSSFLKTPPDFTFK